MSRKFGLVTERRINYLERSLAQLQAKRKSVEIKLSELNVAYAEELISYETYMLHRGSLLEGKNSEAWDADWQYQTTHIQEALHALHHGVAKDEFASAAKKAFGLLAVFTVVLAALAGIPLQPQITGYAGASAGFVSEANITAYFAVAMSENMADGIEFSTVVAGTDNNNATDNYNNASSGSSMYMAVSNDSNIPVDVCISSDDHMRNAANDVLDLSNFVWDSATSTDAATPTLGSAIAMTTSFASTEAAITGGVNDYFRFWLSAPLSQPGGIYNNTVTFRAVQQDAGC